MSLPAGSRVPLGLAQASQHRGRLAGRVSVAGSPAVATAGTTTASAWRCQAGARVGGQGWARTESPADCRGPSCQELGPGRDVLMAGRPQLQDTENREAKARCSPEGTGLGPPQGRARAREAAGLQREGSGTRVQEHPGPPRNQGALREAEPSARLARRCHQPQLCVEPVTSLTSVSSPAQPRGW